MMITKRVMGHLRMPLGSVGAVRPVFVIGCARSGTTLLGVIIGSNSRIAVFSETQAFFRRSKYGVLSAPWNLDRYVKDWTGAFNVWTRHRNVFSTEEIMDGLRTAESYAEALNVVMKAYARLEGKANAEFGDATPAHVHRINAIRNAFPGARFIHIVRDPKAVTASALKFAGKGDDRWSVFSAAMYWRRSVAAFDQARASGEGVLNSLVVKYEDLVANAECEVRRICSWLKIEFEPGMLTYHEGARNWLPKDASGAVMEHLAAVARPLDGSRTNAWRSSMSAVNIRIVTHVARDKMRQYGYDATEEPGAWTRAIIIPVFRVLRILLEVNRIVKRNLRGLFWVVRSGGLAVAARVQSRTSGG